MKLDLKWIEAADKLLSFDEYTPISELKKDKTIMNLKKFDGEAYKDHIGLLDNLDICIQYIWMKMALKHSLEGIEDKSSLIR